MAILSHPSPYNTLSVCSVSPLYILPPIDSYDSFRMSWANPFAALILIVANIETLFYLAGGQP